MQIAVCKQATELTALGFRQHELTTDAMVGLLTTLYLISAATEKLLPGLSKTHYPLQWRHAEPKGLSQHAGNVCSVLEFVFANGLGMPFTWTEAQQQSFMKLYTQLK